MIDPELVEVLATFTNDIKTQINSFTDEIRAEMNSFKTEIKDEMNSFKTEIKDEMNSFKTEVNEKLDYMNARLTSVENSCTIIEEEHGKKLDLLLDYASANIEKHEEYDEKLDKINKKLFTHDIKLSIIEESDFYKTMIKDKRKPNFKKATIP